VIERNLHDGAQQRLVTLSLALGLAASRGDTAASEATVRLGRGAGTLRIVVTDDGVGGARAAADSGLAGLRDRLEALDAKLVVESEPGRGTSIRTEIRCKIRSPYSQTAVLVLSQHLEPAYALRLVEERHDGAGYLLKGRVGRVQQLLDAVQRVAAGECVVDRAVVDELLARRRRVDPIAELTPREREILALMAEGRSNQGIWRTLWLSPKTVETHIRGAFAKLGIKEAAEDNRRVLAALTYLRR